MAGNTSLAGDLSANGNVNLGATGTARTVNVGTGQAQDTINIGTGGGGDLIALGSDSAKVSITGDNWKVTSAGAGTFKSLTAGSGTFSNLVAGSSLQVGGGTKIKWLAEGTATRGNRVSFEPKAPDNASIRVVATAATGKRVFVHVTEVDRDERASGRLPPLQSTPPTPPEVIPHAS